MNSKEFLKTFLKAIGVIVLLYTLFICWINPDQTAPISLGHKFDKFHDNFLLRKAKLMEKNHFETMILGSSTSEAYSVQSVNHFFKTASFHGSIGGGTTAARYVLFKKALANFSNLKRIIYIADFYEFNQVMAPADLAYNSYLSSELKQSKVMPSKIGFLKHFFSQQHFNAGVIVYKRSRNGYTPPLYDDGSTSISMVLSTVETKNNFFAKIESKNKPKLMEEILENDTTYSRSVLAHFKELNPAIKELYQQMISEAQKRNIQIIFILSPYHYEFKKLLFADEDIKARYGEWARYFNELKNQTGVQVYNPLESAISLDPDSGVWRDGIHYNSFAADYFLQDIVSSEKK